MEPFAQLPFVENAQELDQIARDDDIPMSKSKWHKNLGGTAEKESASARKSAASSDKTVVTLLRLARLLQTFHYFHLFLQLGNSLRLGVDLQPLAYCHARRQSQRHL
jgi:hypothetical protein